MTAAAPFADTPFADRTVADVLEAWPALTAVFLHRRMACPGCAMAPYMTVREAAESYGLDAAALLAELETALTAGPPEGPFAPPLPHATTAS